MGTIAEVREVSGPILVNRYNLYVAVPFTGILVTGIDSGEVIASIARTARPFPGGHEHLL